MKADFLKIAEKFTQKGKNNYFVLIGVLGVLLIAAGDFDSGDIKKEKLNDFSLQSYKNQLEEEVTAFIREIDGVGDARVMISFESGQENIYAQTEKSSTDTSTGTAGTGEKENRHSTYENEYVVIDNSGQETALVEKTMQPAIMGIAVVCSGADDISVVAAVTNSVSVVLDVPTHKICVTKMR